MPSFFDIVDWLSGHSSGASDISGDEGGPGTSYPTNYSPPKWVPPAPPARYGKLQKDIWSAFGGLGYGAGGSPFAPRNLTRAARRGNLEFFHDPTIIQALIDAHSSTARLAGTHDYIDPNSIFFDRRGHVGRGGGSTDANRYSFRVNPDDPMAFSVVKRLFEMNAKAKARKGR